ncbi:MAG: fumarylacetoacetate hydrolase family protein [Actinomycetota bacterium]|nr:fumarylacetoacetate hydrolase family protein [Actinomycetota bacterium]
MKLVRFVYRDTPRYGRLHEDQIELISGDPFDTGEPSGVSMNAERVEWLSPVNPSKIIAVGLNYRDHAAELRMDLPDEPVLFLKPPSAVIGPFESIVYPNASKQVDFEAELAVVVGKTASHVAVAEAKQYILGYTCANDVTARDLQKKDGQWTRAKSFDTFCPLGPHVETDIDPADLSISLSLNGQVKQASSTSRMIHTVEEIISFVSQVMTLLPGDVILTGTPPGVGPVAIGDVVQVEIDGIGSLRNKVT